MTYIPGTFLTIAAEPPIIQQFWYRCLTEVILRIKQLDGTCIDEGQIQYVARALTSTTRWCNSRCERQFGQSQALWDFRNLDEIYLKFMSYLSTLGSPYAAEKYGIETLIWLGMIYRDRLKSMRAYVQSNSEFDFDHLTKSRKLSDFVQAGGAFFKIAANPRYRTKDDSALLLAMSHSFGTWVNILAWVQVNEFSQRAVIGVNRLQP